MGPIVRDSRPHAVRHNGAVGGLDLERSPDGARLQWIDLLRGLAIVLVLVWHAPAVPALFDWPMPEWLRTANNSLLPFRMPLLMFLSGLLLPRALAKNRWDYYLGKARSLVWPYLIWAVVFIGQYGSSPPLTSWRAWYAVGYLWFLFFITVYYLIAPMVVRLPAWLTPWLFMVVSIPLPPGTEKRLLYFGTFFFLGYWFATSATLRSSVRGWLIPVAGVIAIAWGTASAIWGIELAYRGEFALFTVCGILVAAWLAQRARGRWVRTLAFIGRNSIVYYVTHFPLMTLVVFAALQLGWTKDPIIWIPCLLVGLAGATAFAHGRHRPWVAWLFEMPGFLTNWVRAERAPTTTPAAQTVEPTSQPTREPGT